MAKYMAVDVPLSITVIANDPSGEACLGYLNANLDAYGPHRPLVQVKTAADFLDAPSFLPGWRSQQVLKLLAGAALADEWIVWLDGKNHFLGPVDYGSFFTEDGRARTIYTQKKLRHDRRWLAHSLDYFRVSLQWLEELGPLTYTPYPMRADTLRAMLADIEARGDNLEALFRRRKRYTEFYLLYAYVLSQHGAADAMYDSSLPWPATIWKHGPPTLERHIERFQRLGGPFFAVHQQRRGTFLQADREALMRLWLGRDLMTEAEAEDLLGAPAAVSIRKASWWQKLLRR